MSAVGIVGEDPHPLLRHFPSEPTLAAAVVENMPGLSGHPQHDIFGRLVPARHASNRPVEPVEPFKLGYPRIVQRTPHDVLETGPVRPAIREPCPPAHRVEIAFAYQRTDVGTVVDQPHPPVDRPQVVGVDVAADDAVTPAFGQQLHHARPVAAAVRFAGLERIDQHRAMAGLLKIENGVEAARIAPGSDQRAQERRGIDGMRRLQVVEDLEHALSIGKRDAFRAASQ